MIYCGFKTKFYQYNRSQVCNTTDKVLLVDDEEINEEELTYQFIIDRVIGNKKLM